MTTFYVVAAILAISDTIGFMRDRDRRTMVLYYVLLASVLLGAVLYERGRTSASFTETILRFIPW